MWRRKINRTVVVWSLETRQKCATDFSITPTLSTKPSRPRLPWDRRLPQAQRLLSAAGPSWRTAGRKAGSRNDDATQ